MAARPLLLLAAMGLVSSPGRALGAEEADLILRNGRIITCDRNFSIRAAMAIRLYTSNNAYFLFLEDRIGSIEDGKLADFAVLDRDILNCPVDAIREARVLRTYLDGKPVYTAEH